MKITKRQLSRIIREEGYYPKLPKGHIDGQPWPGSLEDLAHEQGRAWGHGSVVDKKGFKAQINKSKKLARGTDSSPLCLSEGQLRRIIRETLLRELSKGEDWHSEVQEEVPGDIQKQLDKNEKLGIPSEAVYDQKTGEWRVEELQ